MDSLDTFLSQGKMAPAWKRVGVRHHHGINIPLSALHTKNSCGVGEFFDLLPIIDWCAQLKFDVIQLLPLNNSGLDPSPYNPVSSCALNFIYLSLHRFPFLEESGELQKKLVAMQQFDRTDQIFYKYILIHKRAWLHHYFQLFGERITPTESFQQFLQQNGWLKPYALFKTLKNHLDDVSWELWPESLQAPTGEKLEELYAEYAADILFYSLLQFFCWSQLKEVKAYANKQGVFLMGDMPILVSRESADVWQNPECFDLKSAAGAPPDQFRADGQYWGFPLLKWDVLKANGYAWWIQRIQTAEHFFDLLRIDHIIGFFRMWNIPFEKGVVQGHYVPKKEEEWGPQGREILSLFINISPMLLIGEDLGSVIPIMRDVMDELGICGTKVIRWERNWKTDESFIPMEEYPLLSVTTVSTHDSESLTEWWLDLPEEAEAYATFKGWEYTASPLTQEQRKEILWDSHHTPSLFHINLLQEYLSFFPELVHQHPQEERINIPGAVLPSNWTYRFRPSVEELISHPGLSAIMQQLIQEAPCR